MKQLKGKAYNLNEVIIGKITSKHDLFATKKDLIYVTNNGDFPNGYLAVITSNNDINKGVSSYIENVGNISELHDNVMIVLEKLLTNCVTAPLEIL